VTGLKVNTRVYMTDEVITPIQNQSTVSPTQTSSSDSSSVPAAAQAPAEKTLKQSEVNELVGRIKHEAYQRGLQEAAQKAPQPIHTQNIGMGGMGEAVTPDKIKEMVSQGIQEQQSRLAAQQIISQFAGKMQRGMGKYSDFEKVVAPLQLQTIPQLVELSNAFENTDEIMYDLGKNPSKVANLLTLSAVAPHLAHAEMQKLSESIRQNEEAAKQAAVKAPLSQVSPSNVGTDTGKTTIRDLRNQPWLRG
jgi:hypothetical protein